MKILKSLILIIILSIIAFAAYTAVIKRVQSNELDVTEFALTSQEDKIQITLFTEFDIAKVTIYDVLIESETVRQNGNTIINIPITEIEHNELLVIEISMFDKANVETGKAVISDVCISTDGKVPKYDIKTLLLYNYQEEGFPEFKYDKLSSLFIYAENNNIDIDDFNHIMELKSVYLKGVAGSTKSLKNFENLRRLVINNAPIYGDLDNIDGLEILKELTLTDTKINGELKDLVPLCNIISLHIESNRSISGKIKWLKKLKDIEDIQLISCNFTGDLVELEDLENLSNLKIENCNKITGSITLNNGEQVSVE